MPWLHDVSCVFGGALLTNAVQHLVDLRTIANAVAVGLGMLLMALLLARAFGRFQSGSAPRGS